MNNSAIEDGSAGASPPPSSHSTAGGDSASAQSGVVNSAAAASQASSSEGAPGTDGQNEIDPLDVIYDELAAKGERTNDSRSASPSKADDPATDPSAAAAAATQQPAAATNKDPKEQQRQTAEYDGLTADARGLLKSTNLLIAPADWNAMPPTARQSLMESAKNIRAAKEQLFQAQRHEGTQARSEAQGQQGSGQQQQNPNPQFQNQQPQAQQAQNQQAQTPAEIDAAYKQLGTFGEDLVNPVRAILGHQQQTFNGHLQTLTGHFKEALEARDRQYGEQINFLLNRLTQREEHEAYEGDELKPLKAIPEFSTREVRDEINRNARALLRAQFSAGNRDFTLKEALVQAARTRFHDKLQQVAQANLADARSRSLKGTSNRPAAVVPTPRPKPKDESLVMDDVYDELLAKAK